MGMAERFHAATRKKLELEEEEKIYPNIFKAHSVPCAHPGNEEQCKKAFNQYCPVHFIIDNVRGTQHKEYPICRWEIDYIAANGELPGEGRGLETLVNLILAKLPDFCIYLDKGLAKKKKVTIIYGVICKCDSPVFEDADVEEPLHLIKKIRQINIRN